MAWAYICTACDHPLSRHRSTGSSGEAAEWTFRCAFCDCTVGRESPSYDMTERQFRETFPDLYFGRVDA